jgi:hypothetical protein
MEQMCEVCAQKSVNAFKKGIIESLILKGTLFRFWWKWVTNGFVFYARRYVLLQREAIVARIEAGLLIADRLTLLWEGLVCGTWPFVRRTDACDI